jgi:surface antigen bspA
MKRIHVEEPLDPSKFDTKFEGIYENAFAESKNLIEIKLPKNTKEIRHKAFSNCSNLQAVVITAQVDKLSEKAFEDREGLVIYVPTEAIKSEFEKMGKFEKTKVVVGNGPVANNTITADRAYRLAFEEETLILSSLTAESQEVALYDLQGHSIARTMLPGNSTIRLSLPQGGCYVLTIQGEVSKVFIP